MLRVKGQAAISTPSSQSKRRAFAALNPSSPAANSPRVVAALASPAVARASGAFVSKSNSSPFKVHEDAACARVDGAGAGNADLALNAGGVVGENDEVMRGKSLLLSPRPAWVEAGRRVAATKIEGRREMYLGEEGGVGGQGEGGGFSEKEKALAKWPELEACPLLFGRAGKSEVVVRCRKFESADGEEECWAVKSNEECVEKGEEEEECVEVETKKPQQKPVRRVEEDDVLVGVGNGEGVGAGGSGSASRVEGEGVRGGGGDAGGEEEEGEQVHMSLVERLATRERKLQAMQHMLCVEVFMCVCICAYMCRGVCTYTHTYT